MWKAGEAAQDHDKGKANKIGEEYKSLEQIFQRKDTESHSQNSLKAKMKRKL